MTRIALLVLLATTACQDSLVVGAGFSRAELRVDPALPTELVHSDVILSFYGGDEDHYVRLEKVEMWPQQSSGPGIPLALELGVDALLVPAHSTVERTLHATAHNSELIGYCQSTYWVTALVSLPADPAVELGVMDDDLVIWCP
jgi:hypothetical protein